MIDPEIAFLSICTARRGWLIHAHAVTLTNVLFCNRILTARWHPNTISEFTRKMDNDISTPMFFNERFI